MDRIGLSSASRHGSFPQGSRPVNSYGFPGTAPYHRPMSLNQAWSQYQWERKGHPSHQDALGSQTMRPYQPDAFANRPGRPVQQDVLGAAVDWRTGQGRPAGAVQQRIVYDPSYRGPRPPVLVRGGGYDSSVPDHDMASVYRALSQQRFQPGVNPYAAYAHDWHSRNDGSRSGSRNRFPYPNPYAQYAMGNEGKEDTGSTALNRSGK